MAGAPLSDASVVLPPLLQQLRHFQCSARQRSRLHWLSSRGAANTRVAWSRRLSSVIRCSPSPLPAATWPPQPHMSRADGRGGPGELGDQRRGLGCGVRPCQTGRCCPHRLQSRRISAQPGDFTHQVRHARDVSPCVGRDDKFDVAVLLSGQVRGEQERRTAASRLGDGPRPVLVATASAWRREAPTRRYSSPCSPVTPAPDPGRPD